MISAQPSNFSSLNSPRGPDVPSFMQDPTENIRSSPNCAGNFKNGQPLEESTWSLSNSQKELRCSQHDSTATSQFPLVDPQQVSSPNQTGFTSDDGRPILPLRRSSGSLASSIQTVIHLSSTSAVDPASTRREARGSFVESESGSFQLLSELSTKSSGENHLGPNSQALDDSEIHVNQKSSKIQFHDVVRIAGGISSNRNRKRKQASKQPPRRIQADRHGGFATEQRRADSSSRSPLRYSVFPEGLPNYVRRKVSESDCSDVMSVGYRQTRRLDPRDSLSSPVGRSFSNSRQNHFRPGPPSARSSFSYRSDSISPSKLNNINVPSASHPTGISLSRAHSLSVSSSFTPSSHFPATINSRSSSPASSLYLPLRIPVVRAPAPFFGPTPERVARVRERRQVAQRDAERAKGGWKAWWNNWFHQSDKLVARKGKAKQCSSHDHQDFHSEVRDGSDSDDGSCYHDVILEHERKKLERKLKKLEQIRVNVQHNPSQSCAHPHKKRKSGPQKNASQERQTWLSWMSSLTIGLPPPPAHPLKLPIPGSGILSPPSVTANPILPSKPVLLLTSNQSYMSLSGPAPKSLATVQEVNSRTPLLAQSHIVSHYGNSPMGFEPQESFSSDLAASQDLVNSKSPSEVRFGSAPRRWLTISWWRWKIARIFHLCRRKIVNKFDEMFHIDWDTNTRYEGWENA